MAAKCIVSTENLPYEEWLDFRKRGIGGSDAAVACGISRYKSPVELWMEKTGQLPYKDSGESAYWGTQLESLVRSEFTNRTGIQVKIEKQLLQSDMCPFMLANLDGVCEDSEHGICIFEAKTASAFKAGEWEDSIPDEYMIQIQHYMSVTGYQGAYIAVLIGGNSFKWRFVERDEELIRMIVKLEKSFWKHVQDNTPPSLDGSEASAKYLSERFSKAAVDSKVILPDSAVSILSEYDKACEELERITDQKQKAENRLKQLIGEKEIGILGDRIISWKNISQERLDGKTLKAEHPKIYQKYASKISYRRFVVKPAV